MSKKSFFNWNTWRKMFLSVCGVCVCVLGAYAQSVTVSGTVTETSGDPLANVSITVKGSTVGVVSNDAGQYSIRVPDGNAILVFSFVGFVTQEVSTGNKTTVDVVMSEDVQQISEVVVVGYGTMERKQLTNSITSISARDLPAGVAGATITNAMKGKVSNLIIQETPSPNSSTTLQLRGMASVNTSRAPLVVIDGMPGGDIRSIVQEDIQSIDILKDASAGAIYGTRATGGVILITTKQAKEGKMRLSYTGEAILKKNFGKPRVLTADEYRRYKPTQNDYGGSADWWDEGMAANPTSQRHVVTVQGGADAARVYASAMYEDNRGVLMGDNRKDYGGRINGSFKLVDGWLDINTHIDYRRANRNQATPRVISLIGNNPTHSPNASDWITHGTGLGDQNIIRDAQLATDEGIDTWFRPDVELKLNILPIEGLAYHQTAGYENRQWEWHKYQPSNSTQTEDNNRSGKGTAELKFDKTELLNYDGYFSYVRNIGSKHFINAAAGYSYFQQNGEMFRLKNYGFAVDAVQMWDMGKGTGLNNASATHKAEMESTKRITQKLLAAFGRVNYSYLDRYLASATFRREGSSKFAVNRRWGDFWQLSAAWRLSKENFLQDTGWLNDLKVRVAYGVTGNEGFEADYAAIMYGSSDYVQLPTGEWAYSYGISKNINPDLGWEEKHEWNIGVDYELFDRRVFGKLDFYSRNVEGLIYNVNVPQPPYTEPQMYKNIGTLKNTGWEFEIGANIVQSKDLNYTSRLNLSHNSTTIGSLWGDQTYRDGGQPVGREGSIHRIQENSTVGSFFIYKHAGFDEQGRFQAYDREGRVIVPEIDGKNQSDRQFLGNYMPTVTLGWSHNLTWKQWSLGMTLTSWIDYDIYNELEHTQGTLGGLPAEARNLLLDAYTRNSAIKGQTLASDYFLQDGTFLKIQNLTLAYTLNMKQYLKVMETARVYFTANNLYTFTKYRGLNPEIDITGWEGGIERSDIYPQTRTFTFGIQLNF